MNDGPNDNPGQGHGHGNNPGGPDDRVTINVDGHGFTLPHKEWVVSELKAQLGIDPAKVLAEITPNGLNDLADDAPIKLHNNQRFMTHARSGGSS
jgi:hypothetical protein